MNRTVPTVSVPVTGLVEVENLKGDSLCLNTDGKKGWLVQVIRKRIRGRRGGSPMQIFNCSVSDEEHLKVVVDEFLAENYDSFKEDEEAGSVKNYAFLGVLGSLLVLLLGLTVLAFMISFFLQLDLWPPR